MKIETLSEQSNGLILIMNDQSKWLRTHEGIWSKVTDSLEDLQKEFESLPFKDGRQCKAI